MIFSVRVTAGQERIITDVISSKLNETHPNIYSIAYLPGMKGYLFLEGEDLDSVKAVLQGVQHVRGIIPGNVSIDEIKGAFDQKSMIESVDVGDLIEVRSGPFKGERAKITKINEEKEEVVIELVDVAVPIPVTVKIDAIKIIQKVGE